MRSETYILSAHVKLRMAVARLTDARTAGELKALLDALRPDLANHFGHEERVGGLFDKLAQTGRVEEAALKAQRQEHAELLAEVDALVLRCESSGEAPVDAVRAFVARMRLHEEKENRLLLSGLPGRHPTGRPE